MKWAMGEMKKGLKVVRVDRRVRPVPPPEPQLRAPSFPPGVSPRPEQHEAAIACVDHQRGIVSSPTGSGKSMMIVELLYWLRVPTLIVVPTLELKRQMTETIQAAFGRTSVGSKALITVANVDSLDPRKPVLDKDCVIIDEFHHSAAKTYRVLNKKAWKNVYYRFGFTATPFRADADERLLLESVLSQVIYRLDHKTAVDKGYVVPVEAYYIDLPQTKVEGGTWPQVYAELVTHNEARTKAIAETLDTLYAAGKSTLCLVKEIAHGEAICDALRLNTEWEFAKGINDNNGYLIDKFNEGGAQVLIGTTGILGEGVDTRPAEFIVIAGLGKSKNQFMQQVGRGSRRFPGKESCKVILFKDSSHVWTRRHFAAQVKILREEYGCEPIRLDV